MSSELQLGVFCFYYYESGSHEKELDIVIVVLLE